MSELPFSALADASRSEAGRLSAFRQRSIKRHTEWKGRMIPYWDIGPDESRAVVFLPGGNGHGEIWFPYMLELSRFARCIAVSIPPCGTLAEYDECVSDILDACGVDRVLYVGTSVGGAAAQVFLHRHPDTVDGVALCLTGAASADLPPDIKARWAGRARRSLRIRLSPFGAIFRSTVAREAYVRYCPDKFYDNMIFWREYLVDTYRNYVYKKQYLAVNTKLVPSFYRDYAFRSEDLADWKGRVLILEAEDDQLYGEAERSALRALYPNASVCALGEGGQFGLYLHEKTALSAMEAWMTDCWPDTARPT